MIPWKYFVQELPKDDQSLGGLACWKWVSALQLIDYLILTFLFVLDETYPPEFLDLCGLFLPATNNQCQGDQGDAPGSADDKKEDEAYSPSDKAKKANKVLDCLNTLNIDIEPEEVLATDFEQLTPAPRRHVPTPIVTTVKLFDSLAMRIFDFCQPGCTIGQGELMQTRSMMTCALTLPGGVQINSVDATITFNKEQVAQGSLKHDKAYLEYLQQKLNRLWKEIVDRNGRLGDSYEYTLTDLPERKGISLVEGFVNPNTFMLPQDDDLCSSNTLCFNAIDNTSEAVTITVHVLVEPEQTKTVWCKCHRHVKITCPNIKSLPVSLLPQIAGLLEADGQNAAAAAMAQNLPDLMDTDGTVRSPIQPIVIPIKLLQLELVVLQPVMVQALARHPWCVPRRRTCPIAATAGRPAATDRSATGPAATKPAFCS